MDEIETTPPPIRKKVAPAALKEHEEIWETSIAAEVSKNLLDDKKSKTKVLRVMLQKYPNIMEMQQKNSSVSYFL